MIDVADKTKDIQSRKWQITINNPMEHSLDHEKLKELLAQIKPVTYWCMADEQGLEANTYHTHIYILCSSAVRFSRLKKLFPTAHIEKALGSTEENRNYVFKIGKWKNDKKAETQVPDTMEEYGELPVEGQGKRTDLMILYEMIKDGLSNYEILERCSDYLTKIDTIERVRQTVREEQYKTVFRELEVTYIYGATATGKTRSVMERYGYENIYRVTDYQHPFDNYKGQDIIIFEEFRSSLRIGDMLNYLDGYPVELPCRYVNKIACYTKVYLISNISLTMQYECVQKEENETWKAFLRRIHKVIHYTAPNTYKEYLVDDYIKEGFFPLEEGEDVPFL